MKQSLVIIISLIYLCCLPACNTYDTEVVVVADIRLVSDAEIQRVQATLTATNLNNHTTFASSEFENDHVSLTVLKGAYRVNVDGVAMLVDDNHRLVPKTFRAATEYAEILNDEDTLKLNMLIMEN